MKVRSKTRVAVIFNRDFEGADADPENRAREDIKEVAQGLIVALRRRGFEAAAVGVADDVHAVMTQLREIAPAAVFNLCESIGGDNRFEALMPMLLELAGMAYTGSAPLALAMALHKDRAKQLLRAAAVPTPKAVTVARAPLPWSSLEQLAFPLIVKPTREDASVGISAESVVHTPGALEARITEVLTRYRQPALVEEFIAGREIYVSLLGRLGSPLEVLPLHEIDFSRMPANRPRIVSFEGKWSEGSVDFVGTEPIRCVGLGPEVEARVKQVALAAFEALELRDYGRVDVRLASDGTPYVIDVNPNCDLSEKGGGFFRAARASGLSYEALAVRLVDLALARRSDAHTLPLVPRPKRTRGATRATERKPLPAGGGSLRA